MKPRRPDQQDAITAALIGLDAVAREMEAKWGVGRLVTLVSDQTRASFRRGWVAWHDAQANGDGDTMLDIIPKMVKAWRYMDAEATKLGAAPLSPEVWETRTDDARVLAIVRTQAEAAAVTQADRSMLVYTLAEVARLLRRIEIVDAIKVEFPGATVERTVQLSEGYADSWATAEPLHDMLHGDQDVRVTA